ncbi:hypothetical protein CHF27_000490 [Romboutsia maritimum]|uniref:DUF4097 domain-containing protein n=1 Tax=Romboutsia maritimum TaxID=2020948 RepID=A0A371IW55_9FIRM|nr:DUF4097 family beta strand repeat-containing protein [Romboutsia maritimum]RDY24711.1 hypothetical protein CHF27_000490 [Romboutsia maritimum]
MNKKLSIFAVVLIIIGIIGTIFSGIKSMPYFMKVMSNAEKEINRETNIYNKDVDINKLYISTIDSNIVIKKHNKNNIVINEKGKDKYAKFEVNSNENLLEIKQLENSRSKVNDFYNIKNLNDLLNIVVENIYKNTNHSIVVYIPKDADIEVITESGNLKIEDDIFLDNLTFKTSLGYVSLPKDILKLSKLDIKSNGSVQLAMSELLGIKDVNIEARDINIYSDDKDIFINDIESYIPENIAINQRINNPNYGNVNINTNIPVANNININGYNSDVTLDLPIQKYKINFDIKSSENILLQGLVNKNIVSDKTTINENIREIKGILNKQLENLEKQYNVNVKSQNINIY